MACEEKVTTCHDMIPVVSSYQIVLKSMSRDLNSNNRSSLCHSISLPCFFLNSQMMQVTVALTIPFWYSAESIHVTRENITESELKGAIKFNSQLSAGIQIKLP